MNTLLAIASLAEAGTGAVLLAYPPIVIHLLFGAEIGGVGITMSRIAGIALLGLGVACWPGNSARQPLYGMLTYSTLVALYLIVVAQAGAAGILLWPAVAVHAGLCALLVRAGSKAQKTPMV